MRMAVFLDHVRQAASELGRPVPEVFARLRGLGFEGVEVDGDSVENAPELKKQLDAAGLAVCSIYSMYDWGRNPRDMHEYRQIQLARELGAQRIMPVPGFFSDHGRLDEEVRMAEMKKMISGMKTLVKAAKSEGVPVTMEDYDHAASPIATIRGMQRFLQEVPELHVTLDTGNFFFSGENVLSAWALFRDRIDHVHLKDRMIGSAGSLMEVRYGRPSASPDGLVMYPCAVGEGVIPVPVILHNLLAEGYDGYVTVEHFGAARQWDTICESSEYVRTNIA